MIDGYGAAAAAVLAELAGRQCLLREQHE